MSYDEYEMFQDIPSKESGSTNEAYGIPYDKFKNYLKKDMKLKQVDFNQIANMIYIDYHVNIRISDMPPHEYWGIVLDECNESTRNFVSNNYAAAYDLPYEFWNMDYFDFLNQRRKLMANSIKRYYEKL